MLAPDLTLTRDELRTFLTILGLANAAGLDAENSATSLDNKEIIERQGNGEMSLISRGLLKMDGTDVAILDDILVALVGAAALPVATAVFTWVGRNRTVVPYYFSATSQVLVEHATSQGDTHAFSHLNDSATLVKRVSALLAPLCGAVAAGDTAVLLPGEAFSAFVRLAVAGNAEATARLTAAGCPLDIAVQLTGDFGKGAILFGTVGWGLRDPAPAGSRTLVAAMVEDRCWLVEDAPVDRSLVRIRRAAGAECQTAFLSLLEPLTAARAGT